MSEANDITARLLIEIPKRFPGARVWRNNRVDVMVAGRGGKPRRVMAGIDGQADITGIFALRINTSNTIGFRIECEVKSTTDRIRESQLAFCSMVREHGGLYLVCRDIETTLTEIANWERERLTWLASHVGK